MGPATFYDEDMGAWLAVRDDGILVLRRGEVRWTLAPHGSLDWDSLHQRIYVDGRWIEPCSDEDAACLPPLPAPMPAPARRWADDFDPDLRVPASVHPRLAARLAGKGAQTVYVVLIEDLWETRFGDGHYHYLHGAHFDEAAARAQQRTLDGEHSRGHLRVMTVRRDGDELCMPVFTVETFDHCTVKDILAMLETALEPG